MLLPQIRPGSAGPADSSPPPLVRTDQPTALDKFLHGDRPAVTRYRARRRLEAANERFGKRAFLEVMTARDPERGFVWSVLALGGSDLVLRKVLLPALEAEEEILARGPATSEFTPANYVFRELPSEAGLARVGLTPRRKDKLLVDGALFLSPDDGGLVRVAGRLARSPSFWTTRVEVAREYALIAGVRMPVLVTAVAHVRLAGRSTFSMRYDYEMVNGALVLPVRNDSKSLVRAGAGASRSRWRSSYAAKYRAAVRGQEKS